MPMTGRIVVVALLGLQAPVAHADHHDMAMGGGHDTAFGAGVSLVAASYSTLDYIGNYQGVVPTFSWGSAAYSVGASFAMYRLETNGLERFGPGDFAVHGLLRLYHHDAVTTGLVMMVTAPTGDSVGGLGMGHSMAMPAAWGAWAYGQATLTASVGFGRALVGSMSTHHDHGPWPLVEPMNMSELTWSAACDIALGDGIHGGARATGGVPVGEPGHDRVVGAARLAWGAGRVETAAELQVGLVGDPFTLRGLVETALHF